MNSPGQYVPNMLLEISGEITPERMKVWSQSMVTEARSDAVKAILHRNLKCQVHESRQIGSGQKEMARVNVDIIGFSELRWTGMGEFNSDDHCIYYCGQESLRRNGVAIIVNKSLKCSTWMQSQKQQNDLCLFPRQTIQYHGNPSLCPDQ